MKFGRGHLFQLSKYLPKPIPKAPRPQADNSIGERKSGTQLDQFFADVKLEMEFQRSLKLVQTIPSSTELTREGNDNAEDSSVKTEEEDADDMKEMMGET